jgi:hypothetical protein
MQFGFGVRLKGADGFTTKSINDSEICPELLRDII